VNDASDGELLYDHQTPLKRQLLGSEAEFQAALIAAQVVYYLAEDHLEGNLDHVILQGDSEQVMRALKGQTKPASPQMNGQRGSILSILSGAAKTINFEQISRKDNQYANGLARAARTRNAKLRRWQGSWASQS
jgi:hypothetical protein